MFPWHCETSWGLYDVMMYDVWTDVMLLSWKKTGQLHPLADMLSVGFRSVTLGRGTLCNCSALLVRVCLKKDAHVHIWHLWPSVFNVDLISLCGLSCPLQLPGVASCPVLWRSGRPFWTWRRPLMNSVSAAPCWNSWPTRQWWRATGRELLRSDTQGVLIEESGYYIVITTVIPL